MKPDPESEQMPKRSRADDLAKSMTGQINPKQPMKPTKVSSDIGVHKQKQKVATSTTSRGRISSDIGGKAPVNKTMADMSPEFEILDVDELDREG